MKSFLTLCMETKMGSVQSKCSCNYWGCYSTASSPCWAQRADAQLHAGLGRDGGHSLGVPGEAKLAKYSASGSVSQLCHLCFLIACDFQD